MFKTNWFFQETSIIFKILFIYIRGDMIILLPFLLLVAASGLISLKLMLILVAAYVAVRNFGEMIYWICQQFGKREYRPNDFGLKNLDNNAIYIIYQTFSLVLVVISISLLIFFLVA